MNKYIPYITTPITILCIIFLVWIIIQETGWATGLTAGMLIIWSFKLESEQDKGVQGFDPKTSNPCWKI